MKKEDVPQDLSSLGRITKEVCYATDESGKYTTALSKGWDIKITALDTAWNGIDERIKQAREKVLANGASPLLYYMEKSLMDVKILADYSGFWQWQVKNHLKPSVFNKLSDKMLERYAHVFNISAEELKNINLDGA